MHSELLGPNPVEPGDTVNPLPTASPPLDNTVSPSSLNTVSRNLRRTASNRVSNRVSSLSMANNLVNLNTDNSPVSRNMANNPDNRNTANSPVNRNTANNLVKVNMALPPALHPSQDSPAVNRPTVNNRAKLASMASSLDNRSMVSSLVVNSPDSTASRVRLMVKHPVKLVRLTVKPLVNRAKRTGSSLRASMARRLALLPRRVEVVSTTALSWISSSSVSRM